MASATLTPLVSARRAAGVASTWLGLGLGVGLGLGLGQGLGSGLGLAGVASTVLPSYASWHASMSK